MFYMCLTMLVLVGSIVLGNPWLTRSLTVVLISETYVIFIQYVTNATRHHIGIQIRTTDVTHTLAYQVIPTSLNRHEINPRNLPPDYNLYVGDILFDHDVPAIGLPNVVDEVAFCAPPPYLEPPQPLAEAARNPLLNLGNRPFGLPRIIRRYSDSPQGTTPEDPLSENIIMDAELAHAISGALYLVIRICDPHDEQRGGGVLGSNQTPLTPPLTRANSPAGIQSHARVLPGIQGHHVPPRHDADGVRPLGQHHPRPPPQSEHRLPAPARVEQLARRQVSGLQQQPHRTACCCACCCACCRPSRPWVATAA